jgi:PAP2 superfamily protein
MQLHSHWRSYVRSVMLTGATVMSVARPAAAQKSVTGMIGKDIEHAARDVWAVWTSPFDASAHDLLAGLFVVGAGAAMSPIDDDVDRWAVRNKDASAFDVLDPIRKGGRLYGGSVLAPVAGVAYIVGIATKNQGVRDAIMGCGATWGANNVLRAQVLYRFIARERPDSTRGRDPNWPAAQPGDQYNIQLKGFDGSPWGMHSFPGGHIANIAGCAAFFNNRFHWGFVEPILYAFTGAVWVARTLDRGHWTSDEWVGTVFGYAIGNEIAHQQLRRQAARNAATAGGGASSAAPPKDGLYFVRTSEHVRVGWQLRF